MLLWLLRKFVYRVAAIPVRRRLAAFERATRRPQEVQRDLLKRILQHHDRTDFGKRHKFSQIRSIADFRRQLPVATYEYFEPYIQRVAKGDYKALLADPHI